MCLNLRSDFVNYCPVCCLKIFVIFTHFLLISLQQLGGDVESLNLIIVKYLKKKKRIEFIWYWVREYPRKLGNQSHRIFRTFMELKFNLKTTIVVIHRTHPHKKKFSQSCAHYIRKYNATWLHVQFDSLHNFYFIVRWCTVSKNTLPLFVFNNHYCSFSALSTCSGYLLRLFFFLHSFIYIYFFYFNHFLIFNTYINNSDVIFVVFHRVWLTLPSSCVINMDCLWLNSYFFKFVKNLLMVLVGVKNMGEVSSVCQLIPLHCFVIFSAILFRFIS